MLSLGFLLASNLLLLLFTLLPTGIGVVFLDRLGESIGLLPEILLVHDSILADDECHHSRRPVFSRIGHESETLAHFAVYDVIFRAAWAILTLTRQNEVIVTAVGSRSAALGFTIAHGKGRCHQRPDGALGFAVSSFPIQAIVLPFIAKDSQGVLVVLRGVILFLRRHKLLANLNG